MMEEMAAAAFSGRQMQAPVQRPQPRAIPWKVKFIPDGNQGIRTGVASGE